MPPLNSPDDNSLERWRCTRAIFAQVHAAPVDERLSILADKCDGDADLFNDLNSLLTASLAEEVLSESMSETVDVRENFVPKHKRIGPYELDRLLGRGGMGAVYLAHRVDGQFHQQVAIKLIDLPLATDLYRERFRRERQILAVLAHPYIARLIDGGVSDDGNLYLAMEFIDGISILQYCRQHQLSIQDRLILFKSVCSAVQYAHQNLVIHRDLKPDNILVVSDGTPRLLDFGTAKLIAPLPEDSLSELTLQGLQLFTPQYASPEQVLGRTISTASDIYSLGVLLYYLVADVAPYVLKEFTTEEMLCKICVEQPPKPSALAVSAEAQDADLDSIVLMAMRKEPEDRYLTVDQFAADIQAWLEGRSVKARRGTLRYGAGKFARRNKLLLGAVSLLVVVALCWAAAVAHCQQGAPQGRGERRRDA